MKKICFFMVVCMLAVFAVSVRAESLVAETDLANALEKAKTENKMLFIQFGREACGNCQSLKKLIRENKVDLSPNEFVYADLDCDDKKTEDLFFSKFTGSGSTLPFVVITNSSGKQLAFTTGYADEKAYNSFIKKAKDKVGK